MNPASGNKPMHRPVQEEEVTGLVECLTANTPPAQTGSRHGGPRD